jgi:hypothetical protein
MMTINFAVLAGAALIPLLIGFIWYNPKVFGTAWMASTGLDEEKLKGANMAVIFIVCYVFAFLLAMSLNFMVIHQFSIMSILANEPNLNTAGSDANTDYMNFIGKYGDRFRTFKHGAFHGALASLFFALPVLGTCALFERKGFKYIAIHTGYWLVSLALMGGVICQYA